jgi:hypothetical protein
MRAPNCGERKHTEPDFIRLKQPTAAAALAQLVDSLNDAELFPSKAISPDLGTMHTRFVTRDLKLQRRQIRIGRGDPPRAGRSVS